MLNILYLVVLHTIFRVSDQHPIQITLTFAKGEDLHISISLVQMQLSKQPSK
jgi:hypothetical protein